MAMTLANHPSRINFGERWIDEKKGASALRRHKFAAVLLLFTLHQGQLKDRALLESQPLIDRDGARVVLPHVQERHLAALADARHHLEHQLSRIALPEVVGMGTHGADFDESRAVQPHPCHRHQLALFTYAKKSPEFARTRTERSRFSELSERQHLGLIGRS